MTDPDRLARDEAGAIVREASAAYFDACRARIEPFVDRNFSLCRLGAPAPARDRLGPR